MKFVFNSFALQIPLIIITTVVPKAEGRSSQKKMLQNLASSSRFNLLLLDDGEYFLEVYLSVFQIAHENISLIEMCF